MPAEQAGFKKGDVILAFNRQAVSDARALRFRIAAAVVGGALLQGGRAPIFGAILGAVIIQLTVLAA